MTEKKEAKESPIISLEVVTALSIGVCETPQPA